MRAKALAAALLVALPALSPRAAVEEAPPRPAGTPQAPPDRQPPLDGAGPTGEGAAAVGGADAGGEDAAAVDGGEGGSEGAAVEDGAAEGRPTDAGTAPAEPSPALPPPLTEGPPRPRPPDPLLEAARVAWRYFEHNYQATTGFVNSVDGYPSTTMWDLGSTVLATLAARELGIIDSATFATRIEALLRTLSTQPLFMGELPNKAYDAATGNMADYANAPSATGIGFSALDLGRLVSALTALAQRAPEHRAAVQRVLQRWRYCRLLGGGELHGASRNDRGKVQLFQEGRLGYEQYGAESLARLGFRMSRARDYGRFAADTPILGLPVRHDTRDARRYGAVNALVSDPWILGAFEFGRDGERGELLRQIFEVQKRRWERTGIATAAGEDHVDEPPWFVYGAIWADGVPWAVVTPTGQDATRFRALSTKVAFALATLFPEDPYAGVLRRALAQARDPERGWYAGVYEGGRVNRSLNVNTNGVILEAVLFRRTGPLHAAPGEVPLAGLAIPTAFRGETGACYPGTPEAARLEALPIAPEVDHPAPRRRARLYPYPLTLQAFADYRGVDRGGAGAVATLWPWGASFLRFGAESTPFSPTGRVRMLWGIGWDDWRDRTLYLHLDNWGPIRPEDAIAIHGAEVNFGYRGPRLCGGALCLAPLLGGTVPFAGGPYVRARATLTIGGKWFAMGGIGWTVPRVFAGPAGTPRWRIEYGFGRWDWRPGTFYVTYYDWGPTTWSHNGVLAVGVNLGF